MTPRLLLALALALAMTLTSTTTTTTTTLLVAAQTMIPPNTYACLATDRLANGNYTWQSVGVELGTTYTFRSQAPDAAQYANNMLCVWDLVLPEPPAGRTLVMRVEREHFDLENLFDYVVLHRWRADTIANEARLAFGTPVFAAWTGATVTHRVERFEPTRARGVALEFASDALVPASGFVLHVTFTACADACSTHGDCSVDGECTCDAGWSGATCASAECTTSCGECRPALAGVDATRCGTCATTTNANACVCNGYPNDAWGANCDDLYCSGVTRLSGAHGTLRSHAAGGEYHTNANCTWVLTPTDDDTGAPLKTTVLTIESLALDAPYDAVWIGEGDCTQSGGIAGPTAIDHAGCNWHYIILNSTNDHAPMVFDTGSQPAITVHFTSDYVLQAAGFVMHWDSAECPDAGCEHGMCVRNSLTDAPLCLCSRGFEGDNCTTPRCEIAEPEPPSPSGQPDLCHEVAAAGACDAVTTASWDDNNGGARDAELVEVLFTDHKVHGVGNSCNCHAPWFGAACDMCDPALQTPGGRSCPAPTSCVPLANMTGVSGYFGSDGASGGVYDVPASCAWRIEPDGATNTTVITLSFRYVRMDPSPSRAVIVVYDGRDETAPLLAMISGSDFDQDIVRTSTGQAMFVTFTALATAQRDLGFRASYALLSNCPRHPDTHEVCSGRTNGHCVGGHCQCATGRAGTACERLTCPGGTCNAVYGQCVQLAGGESRCQCATGASGPSCNHGHCAGQHQLTTHAAVFGDRGDLSLQTHAPAQNCQFWCDFTQPDSADANATPGSKNLTVWFEMLQLNPADDADRVQVDFSRVDPASADGATTVFRSATFGGYVLPHPLNVDAVDQLRVYFASDASSPLAGFLLGYVPRERCGAHGCSGAGYCLPDGAGEHSVPRQYSYDEAAWLRELVSPTASYSCHCFAGLSGDDCTQTAGPGGDLDVGVDASDGVSVFSYTLPAFTSLHFQIDLPDGDALQAYSINLTDNVSISDPSLMLLPVSDETTDDYPSQAVCERDDTRCFTNFDARAMPNSIATDTVYSQIVDWRLWAEAAEAAANASSSSSSPHLLGGTRMHVTVESTSPVSITLTVAELCSDDPALSCGAGVCTDVVHGVPVSENTRGRCDCTHACGNGSLCRDNIDPACTPNPTPEPTPLPTPLPTPEPTVFAVEPSPLPTPQSTARNHVGLIVLIVIIVVVVAASIVIAVVTMRKNKKPVEEPGVGGGGGGGAGGGGGSGGGASSASATASVEMEIAASFDVDSPMARSPKVSRKDYVEFSDEPV